MTKFNLQKISLSILLLFLFITPSYTYAETNTSLYKPTQEETLNSIARKISIGTNFSQNKWQVAIWLTNPDSFNANNMESLKNEAILTIPNTSIIKNISEEKAIATIEEHKKQWQKYFQQKPEYLKTTEKSFSNIKNSSHIETAPKTSNPILTPHNRSSYSKLQLLLHKLQERTQTSLQKISAIVTSKESTPILIISSGIFLLIIVIWFAISSNTKNKPKNNKEANHLPTTKASHILDNEDPSDYDVFATDQGAPIKLDLARAYINMQDLESAKEILQEVISNHSGEIKTQAKQLLQNIMTNPNITNKNYLCS